MSVNWSICYMKKTRSMTNDNPACTMPVNKNGNGCKYFEEDFWEAGSVKLLIRHIQSQNTETESVYNCQMSQKSYQNKNGYLIERCQVKKIYAEGHMLRIWMFYFFKKMWPLRNNIRQEASTAAKESVKVVALILAHLEEHDLHTTPFRMY